MWALGLGDGNAACTKNDAYRSGGNGRKVPTKRLPQAVAELPRSVPDPDSARLATIRTGNLITENELEWTHSPAMSSS